MFPIKQTITRTGLGYSPKDWREVLKYVWTRTGEFWHTIMLPKHFTHAGAQEYKYQPRQGQRGGGDLKVYTSQKGRQFRYRSYTARKLRTFGHTLPLVWSGNLRKQAMRVRDVRATARSMRVVLNVPPYTYKYRKDSTDPNKAAELAKISPKEVGILANFMDREFDREIKRRNKTVNISTGHRRAG